MDPILRVRDLGRRYFDGLLDEPGLRELEALLQTDPAAADAFARLSRLEGDLSELFAHEHGIRRESDVLDAIDRQERRGRWLSRVAWCAVAASLLIVALGSLWWWLPRPGENPSTNEAVVVSGQVEHSEGVARVMSDEAIVRLGDGSRMWLERDSEYVLSREDRRRVELRRGMGRFTVEKGEPAFRVETPAGIVTVLGTEFTIAVISEEDDEEEGPMKLSHVLMTVAVMSGLVGVESGGEKVRLGVGESRIFAQDREGDRKEGDRKPAVRAQRAMVVSVADNKITVMVAGDEGRQEKTIEVSKDVKVFIDGKASKLSDLSKGMLVALERGAKDGEGLVTIRAQGPTLEATVKSVAKDKITIEGRGRETDPVEFPVSKEAKVTIDGKAGKLDELKAGDRIGLGLSSDKKTVLAIVKGRGGEREGDRPQGIAAKVKAIDAKAGTITLVARGDKEHELSLAKETKVTINGRAGKVEDIKEGTLVTVQIDRESKTVTAIVVGRGGDREGDRAPGVNAKVKSLDAKAGTVTLTVRDRDLELTLAKETKVTINGKAGKLADIKDGTVVTVQIDRESKTVTAIAVGRGGEREGDRPQGVNAKVKSIDAKAGKLTVVVRGDNEKELTLAKEVKVTIDGKAGKLEDIKEGTVISIQIDREKNVTAITVGRGGEREGGEKGTGRVARVLGKVKGAEKSDSTITLFGGREKPEDRLFPVAKDAKITIDGKAAKLEDIKEDMNAILILDSDKKTVKEIIINPARKREGDREKGEEKKEGERKKEGEKKEEK